MGSARHREERLEVFDRATRTHQGDSASAVWSRICPEAMEGQGRRDGVLSTNRGECSVSRKPKIREREKEVGVSSHFEWAGPSLGPAAGSGRKQRVRAEVQ